VHDNCGTTAAAVIDLHYAVPCCTMAVMLGWFTTLLCNGWLDRVSSGNYCAAAA
jgi:hypothetical protein